MVSTWAAKSIETAFELLRLLKWNSRFNIVYDVIRRERSVPTDAAATINPPKDTPSQTELAADLLPNQLVPVSGPPAELAGKAYAEVVNSFPFTNTN